MTLQEGMEFSVSEKDRFAIVTLSGPVNAANTPRLRKTLHELLKKKYSGYIVDFGEVDYMDSSGIATLIESYQMAKDQGAKLVLSRADHDHVQHLFEITRLDDLFDNYPSPEKAIEELKSVSG